jgi:C4-dicarboxylate-specific signal transduction histidine kinase
MAADGCRAAHPRRGSTTSSASSAARGQRLVISTDSSPAEGLRVAIGDSGPRVAPEIASGAASPPSTTKSDAPGIGLSICRVIIDTRAGRLWVDAHELRGAVFDFSLPAHG